MLKAFRYPHPKFNLMKVLNRKEIFTTKWLCLKEISYLDKNKNQQSWEYVCRNRFHGVVTIICRSRKYRRFLFVSQPRPTIDKIEISFPAGLIDNGETPVQAAFRKLKEETGYSGEILNIMGPFPKNAGLSDETSYWVEMVVDENAVGETEMESTEDIQKFWKTPLQLLSWISTLNQDRFSVALDVWAFIRGVRLSRV